MSNALIYKLIIYPFIPVLLIGQMVKLPISDQSISCVDLYIIYAVVIVSIFTIIDTVKKQTYYHLLFVTCIIFITVIQGINYLISNDLSIPSILSALYSAIRFFYPFIMFQILYYKKVNEEEVNKLFRFVLYTCLIHAFFGIIQSLFIPNFALRYGPEYNWDWQDNRLVSTILDPNLAASLYFSIIFILLMTVNNTFAIYAQNKTIVRISILVIGCAAILTLSRGGTLAFVTTVFAGTIGVTKKNITTAARTIIILVVFVMLGYLSIKFFFGADYIENTNRFGASNDSALYRLINYRHLYNLFLDKPFWGVGFNYIPTFYSEGLEGVSGHYADGGLIYLLASYGIVGCLMIGCYMSFIIKQLKGKKLFILLLIFLTVSSLFTSTMFYPIIMVNLMILVLLIESSMRNSPKEKYYVTNYN